MQRTEPIVKAIISKLSIQDYFNTHIVKLDEKKYKPLSDSRVTSICPFHTDTDPSFHYRKQKGFFKCFGCGVAGNVINLHVLTRRVHYGEKISYEDATKELANTLNIDISQLEDTILSPYEYARDLMFNDRHYIASSDLLTVAKFRDMNNKVTNMKMSSDAKIHNYYQLDLLAAFTLLDSEKKGD